MKILKLVAVVATALLGSGASNYAFRNRVGREECGLLAPSE